MKIRIKKLDEKLVYQIDDENGKKINVDFILFETAIKVLEAASKNTTIKYDKAFAKFVENLRSATRYYDLVKTENKKEKINVYDTEKYSKKAIKYDRKAQSLFSIHNGWYENFISIAEEIQALLEKNYEYIDNEVELAYTANMIDSILDKYKRKQKQKTL